MKDFIFPILLICFLGNSNTIFSQEKYDWDKYPTYEEYIATMNKFGEDYPELCKIVEIGESRNGKKLLCAKISDNMNIDEPEPEFFYGAALDGDEPVGFVLMLRLIDYLCVNYGEDAFITRLIDSVEIWINPLGNPDDLYQGHPMAPYINRNHPCPCMEGNHKYFGVYDSWEPETKAFLDFTDKHNFVMGADLNSGVECALWPYFAMNERSPDENWFKFVTKEYADTAQANSPSSYFTYYDGFGHGYSAMFVAHGTSIDYLNFFKHCRAIQLELSSTKIPEESTLPDYWNYNHKALLNFIEQVLFGIRGTVTDSITGKPLQAKVFIENHDKDSSHVYSHLPHGDYYRPIIAGIYDVTFSADGYIPKTISGVHVENDKATVLDVKLYNPTSVHFSNIVNSKAGISITPFNNGIKIIHDFNTNTGVKAVIYDINGREVCILPLQSGIKEDIFIWDGKNNNGSDVYNGCYVVRLEYAGNIVTKRFIFSH